jgi:hypothetical protein|tara:strand:+ start:340 stop:789 length:450 start_codon:yes stop_codon:yes gene_type:complete
MKKQIREIIEWSLKEMDLYSEDAVDLVYKTGNAETGYRHLKQMGGGPAIGFWQVEPATLIDIIDNYVKYRPELEKRLKSLGFSKSGIETRVMSNIALQAVFCRLKYKRDRYALPKSSDLKAQAEYWKRVYNTHLGKGTIEHFMEANNEG